MVCELFSGSNDTTIRIWDAVNCSLIHTLTGHTDWVLSVAFSPDSLRIVSGSDDETIRIWDADSGSLLRILAEHTNSVASVIFSN